MSDQNDLPAPPDYLTAGAKEHWSELIEHVVDAGWTASAADALASYSVAWARWKDAEEHLAETGPIVLTPNGHPIQSPYLAISNRAQVLLLKWARVLGLPIQEGPRR